MKRCGIFDASGPGRLAITDSTIKSALHQKIVKENVRDPKLKHNWVVQLNVNMKHETKSISEWIKINLMTVLEWPSQINNLNNLR